MNPEQVSKKLIDRIREHINRTDKIVELHEHQQEWQQLTSALNVLEDTLCTVDFYCSAEYPSALGGKYLFAYGLLQALFIQQDATNSLSQALLQAKIDFKSNYPEAYAARELRNDVVGHPTNRDNGKAYVYLTQISLQKDAFTYSRQVWDAKGMGMHIKVDLFKSIDDTSKCVNNVLQKAVDQLDKEFMAYIDAHKERKMKKIFDTLGYAREKVLGNDILLKDAGYDSSKQMVKECENELVLRYGSVDAVDSFAYTLEKIHTAYDLIDNTLCDIPFKTRSKIEQFLQEYLFDRLHELSDMSSEVDEDFEKA